LQTKALLFPRVGKEIDEANDERWRSIADIVDEAIHMCIDFWSVAWRNES
jgi:hypothetical protein